MDRQESHHVESSNKRSYFEQHLNYMPEFAGNDMELQLTRKNYKEQFHRLLYWEEKCHVETLKERCCGKYKIFVYEGRPPAVRKYAKRMHKCFCHIDGISSEQIALVTQVCEMVVIIAPNGRKIVTEIVREDFGQLSECLFVALDLENTDLLKECIQITDCWSPIVHVEFEAKHTYFNMLHYAIKNLSFEVIHSKLMPAKTEIILPHDPFKYYLEIIPSCLSEDEIKALSLILQCPACNPPFLINLSFSSAKTSLLHVLETTKLFIRKGHQSGSVIRVLVCFSRQVSARRFIDNYINQAEYDKQYPWRRYIIRLVSDTDYADTENAKNFRCRSVNDFCQSFTNSDRFAVVVTTMMTSLLLLGTVPAGYFTHILLNDVAELQEPEAIAPLCLATQETNVVMAGDTKKVHPGFLVFSDISQRHGLGDSLMERLNMCYNSLNIQKFQCSELSKVYHSHSCIVKLASELFYDSTLQARVAHPDVPYPIRFVCSDLSAPFKHDISDSDEYNGSIVLYQVMHWINEWGRCRKHDVCIICPTRQQVTILRRFIRSSDCYQSLIGIDIFPIYSIKAHSGCMFKAVFFIVTDPTQGNGNSINPNQSCCNQHVFNTVLSMATSLIVCIGNPFILLRIGHHFPKQWCAEYLKNCLKYNTFITAEQENLCNLAEILFGSNVAEIASPSIPQCQYPAMDEVHQPSISQCQHPATEYIPQCQYSETEHVCQPSIPQCQYPAVDEVHIPQCQYPATEHLRQPSIPQCQYHTVDELHQPSQFHKPAIVYLHETLTKNNYKTKFHQLLECELEEHEFILKEKCNGKYMLWFSADGHRPDVVNYSNKSFFCYGYLYTCPGEKELSGDIRSYVMLSTEKTDNVTFMVGRSKIQGTIVRDINKCLYIGFSKNDSVTLMNAIKITKGSISLAVNISFVLKHSYFNRMHQSIKQISFSVISRLFPTKKDFHRIDSELSINNPKNVDLQVDGIGQLQALRVILGSLSIDPPILITGSFGTGKTRLLIRAAHDILHQDRRNKILLCAYQNSSADVLTNQFIKSAYEWTNVVFRYVTGHYETYRSNIQERFIISRRDLKSIPFRVLITTFSTSMSLIDVQPCISFTHILLDEGAQTREPETIIPLCLAANDTKIVIAGDHCQVGPSLHVLGVKARECGLKLSLLERLHLLYEGLGQKRHCMTLLNNYRCHGGILRLPSSLFYNSTLLSHVSDDTIHPDAPYPLMFVCSSLDSNFKDIHSDVDKKEAEILLNQVRKYTDNWPEKQWGEKRLEDVCIVTPSANQKHLIERMLPRALRGISIHSTYDLQGTEYQALFISTNECITEEGDSANPIRSICDRYVFNTALTRAKSLVVCIGNPFKLLKIESHMEVRYGDSGKCWSEYLKRCIECKTFQVLQNKEHHKDVSHLLLNVLFEDRHAGCQPELSLEHDSIINSYTRQFESIPHVRNACLTITRINEHSDNLSWALTPYQKHSKSEQTVEHGQYLDIYECDLSLCHTGEGTANPLDPRKKVVKISSYNNRKGAFDGDRVLIGVLKDNPCIGKVIKVLNHSQSMFISQVDPNNPILFIPINKTNPKIVNLPKLSRALLEMGNQEFLEKGLHATDVVVFEKNWDGKSLPKISDVIPLCVAKDLLFMVRYLCWKSDCRLPLGLVVAVIPKGDTLFHAQRLLKMQYNVVGYQEYDKGSKEDNVNLLSVSADRPFTIDPNDAKILDDALSLKQLSPNGCDTKYEIAVHIVNAAWHILQNSPEYEEARSRGQSFYGTTGHASMLEDNICSSLSLVPNKTRDVISVTSVVTIKGDGSIHLGKPTIVPRKIMSVLQLSYGDAQSVIQGNRYISDSMISKIAHYNKMQPTLEEDLKIMYQIAFKMRQDRIGLAAACNYAVSEEGEEGNWQAHLLVEELMIWANSAVARRMYDLFPHTSILRKQNAPNKEKLLEITTKYSKVLGYCCSLRMLNEEPVGLEDFQIPFFVIVQLKNAFEMKHLPLISYLITSEYLYPQLCVVCTKLNSISSPSEYCCTSASDTSYSHHGLNLPLYTHFTSPLRRFIDIPVQNMILVGPSGNDVDADNTDGYKALCDSLNVRAKNARYFAKNIKEVKFALELTSQSKKFCAVVYESSSLYISLCYPHLKLKEILSHCKSIKFSHLHGTIVQDGKYMWKARIMSFENSASIINLIALSDSFTKLQTGNPQECNVGYFVTLTQYQSKGEDLEQHYEGNAISTQLPPPVVTIKPAEWSKVLSLAQRIAFNPSTVYDCHELQNIISCTEIQHATNQTPISDVQYHDSPFIMYELQRKFCECDLLNVWMSWSLRHSVIVPCLQLIELSPEFRICIQHNESPAECFSNGSVVQASKTEYRNMDEYVSLWKNVIVAEGAENSMKVGQLSIIQNVTLQWPKLFIPPNCFDAPYYQTDSAIKMVVTNDFSFKTDSFFKISEGDLICVRYGTAHDASVKAVFHMVVVNVNKERKSHHNAYKSVIKDIDMMIMGQLNCRISETMKEVLNQKCELQVIQMAVSYRKVFSFLKCLNDKKQNDSPQNYISKLATEIALSRNAFGNSDINYAQVAMQIFTMDEGAKDLWSSSQVPLNSIQFKAIQSAIQNRFQLIQGPPGTGKSETGACLAYTFAITNRYLHSDEGHKCVLYCGPSNKSVDVVLEKLLKIQKRQNLQILRVYSKVIEAKDFTQPDPFDAEYHSSDYKCPPFAQEFALHHLIRKGRYGAEIKMLDDKMKSYGKALICGGELKRKYKNLIAEAKKAVLKKDFDIIFCTCNEVCNNQFKSNVTPRQCIVDECGMAHEPETLAVISLSDHVVLIGDHKQLQPVITYKPAKDSGLGTSLFQRYAEQHENLCITLTTQYRMHQWVQEFPSQQFYGGKLMPGKLVQDRKANQNMKNFWPAGLNVPLAFCDIVGEEEGQNASGTKRKHIAMESKSNRKEAAKAVEIAAKMLKLIKKSDSLAILTPYAAQKNTILQEVDSNRTRGDRQQEKIKILTINESQGDEFDYVILSTVRSLPCEEINRPDFIMADKGWVLKNIGFVTDEHQINVGITRSKQGLVIVGNQMLLQYDPTWRNLIDHYNDFHCIVNEHLFP